MSTESLSVPFVDLYAQYKTIQTEIDAAIQDVIRTSAFIRGPYVEKFETMFAEALGVTHCVSVANGTDSLFIAMHALGVRPGDEVIVPAHSWVATSETVTQAGGTVVFCDTDPATFTIDPVRLGEKITSRTVGIIPVHLYGQPADMDPIMELARRHNLWVIEDCAQAHFARYKGTLVGSFGTAASYSFYPSKNLGAMGDGGAVTTNDGTLAKNMAMFARHGGLKKGDHQIEGINSRLDGLQAALLSVKLPHLPEWTMRRRACAAEYDRLLREIPGIECPIVAAGREHVWHLYVIQCDRRDSLAAHLASRGVQTVVSYPIALPFLPAYRRFKHRPEDFPVAYRHQSRILSLPIYAEIALAQQEHVAATIASFAATNG
jgi:dTDP-4-amino-4,6-dideoxygalactose transaminase